MGNRRLEEINTLRNGFDFWIYLRVYGMNIRSHTELFPPWADVISLTPQQMKKCLLLPCSRSFMLHLIFNKVVKGFLLQCLCVVWGKNCTAEILVVVCFDFNLSLHYRERMNLTFILPEVRFSAATCELFERCALWLPALQQMFTT